MRLCVGDEVEHAEHGVGTVSETYPERIVVEFEDYEKPFHRELVEFAAVRRGSLEMGAYRGAHVQQPGTSRQEAGSRQEAIAKSHELAADAVARVSSPATSDNPASNESEKPEPVKEKPMPAGSKLDLEQVKADVLANVSIRHIAEKAGVNPGAVYSFLNANGTSLGKLRGTPSVASPAKPARIARPKKKIVPSAAEKPQTSESAMTALPALRADIGIQETAASNGHATPNGRAKARFVLIEVEGEGAVIQALQALNKALETRL